MSFFPKKGMEKVQYETKQAQHEIQNMPIT